MEQRQPHGVQESSPERILPSPEKRGHLYRWQNTNQLMGAEMVFSFSSLLQILIFLDESGVKAVATHEWGSA